MKDVAIVAAHFVPSNLTAVHRSRLWVPHLPDFGWQPTIVTTDSAYYEETLVPELEVFLPDELPIIRTRALPTPALRIMGDIGIRGFYWHYRALCRLAEEGLDFIHITIPSFYSALLGRLVYKRYGVPYGIDYIDPWVHDFPVPDVPFGRLKAWGATQLASLLEPWAVRDASLITGVAASYYEQVLERNPHMRTQAVTAAMPYGGAARDQEVVRAQERSLFSVARGRRDPQSAVRRGDVAQSVSRPSPAIRGLPQAEGRASRFNEQRAIALRGYRLLTDRPGGAQRAADCARRGRSRPCPRAPGANPVYGCAKPSSGR